MGKICWDAGIVIIGVNRFGASAPGELVYGEIWFLSRNIIQKAKSL